MGLDKKKKNILLVLDFLESGGATRINQELTRLYTDVDFGVLGAKLNGQSPPDEEFRVKRIFSYKIGNHSNFVVFALNIIKTFFHFGEVIRKFPIDTVVLNLPHSGLGVILNPLSWKLKKIYLFHGSVDLERKSLFDFNQPEDKKREQTFRNCLFRIKNRAEFIVQKQVMNTCDSVFVFSNYSRRLVRDHLGIDERKINKVPPPLSINKIFRRKISNVKKMRKEFNIGSSETVFLVPSRMEPRKGIHFLVDAVKLIREKGIYNFRVILSGLVYSDDYAYFLYEKCKNNSLYFNLNFIKRLERKELYKLYGLVDCVVLPSADLETFGLVTAESFLFGTPVIGFDKGATSEIIGKIDKRLLVDKVSAENLSNKMMWFMNLSPIDRRRIRRKSSPIIRKLLNRQLLKSKLIFY